MTLDKLARMVQHGFVDLRDEMETHYVSLRNQILVFQNETGEKFEKVNHRFTAIDRRLDTMATHERRISRLEKQAGVVD